MERLVMRLSLFICFALSTLHLELSIVRLICDQISSFDLNVHFFSANCESQAEVEVFHKILKSGRGSEDRRLGRLDRLEMCLAIDMITAWRLMYLTILGRETPEVASDLFFSEQEIEVLKLIKYRGEYAANKGKCLPLRDAILVIAILGGHFTFVSNRHPLW